MRTDNNGQLCLIDSKTSNTVEVKKMYSALLRERIDQYGADSLLDEEVVSLLTGISIEVIRKALDDFGLIDSIKYINSLSLTKAQQRRLYLLYMFYNRMLLAENQHKEIINSSSKAGEYCKKLFTGLSYEAFYVICLDSQNRVNYAAKVHEGTINEAPVYPRIIVETALNYRANSVILAHNHPGGSLNPSSADIEVTKKIQKALEPISIKVVDHIIVADNKYASFSESGLL